MQEITRCMNAHHHIRNQMMVIKALVMQHVDYDKQHYFYEPLAKMEKALEDCECPKKNDFIEIKEHENT